MQQAKAMALLQHPNIVQIHEICAGTANRIWPWSTLPGGEPRPKARGGKPLAARAGRRNWRPSWPTAVQAAHAHGVIHRALETQQRPSRRQTGLAKICDFGLAKRLVGGMADPTQTGQLMGTPGYMAPSKCSVPRDPRGRPSTFTPWALCFMNF